jgi:hypothetical protein
MTTEARRNAIALLIAAFVVGAVIAFLLLPGLVLPVGKDTLASSIGAKGFMANGCRRAPGTGNFTCVVPTEGFSDSKHLSVHVSWEGCWEATSAGGKRPGESGCVHIWDY